MLTREAFNALLKTLEEPPPHVKFIFATTAANRLPETVQSRCQRFDLKNISTKDIEKRLSDICKLEGIQVEPPVLQLIARHAKGGLRDSQSILDQLFSFCKDKVSLEDVNFVLGCIDEDRMLGIFDSISGKDTSSALKIVNDILNDGKTPNEFIDQALSCTRDLLVFSSCGAEANWIETDTYFMQKHGKSFSPETLLYMIQILSDARMRTTDFLVQRILLEAAVIKLCRMESLSTLHEIAEKITLLEKNIAHVTHISGNSIEGSVSSQKAVIQQKEKVSESPEEYLAKDEEKRQETLLRENDAWEKILIKINNKKKAVWALLKESRLVGIKNGEITVEFPGAYSFHMEKLNRTEEKKFIEQCAQEVLQTDARLIFTLSKNGNLTGNKVNPISNYDSLDHQENNTIPSEPAVKKTLELFGGQIIRAK
jgi:DNA polymerase-3 subunit gamma/tau